MEPTTSHPELERLLTHQDWLRSLARKLVGDSQTAEDLVQETWIAAMKSPPDPNRPARPWLAGVVRRLASMRARGEGRRTRRQNAVAVADELPSTADLVEEVDTQRRLVGEVLKLSEPYRTTVMLRYFNNLSSAEIARHQDVPAGTVRWRLKRGLDELRERLDDSFGSRENWCIAMLPLAKLSLGTGAGAASGGGGIATLLTGMGAFKWVAGILVLLSTIYVGPLVAERLRPVFAADKSATLVSLEPEQAVKEDVPSERIAVESNSRDALAPADRRIRFIEPNHEPIADLRVVLDDRSEAPPVALTNEQGVVQFTTALRRGTLYVQRSNSFVQRVEVGLTAELTEAILPWQGDLTGRLLAGQGSEQGSIPMSELRLRFDSDVQWLAGADISEAALARFDHPSFVEVLTDEQGGFRVQNLPQDWSGKLWLPEQVVVQGASRREESGRFVYFGRPERDAMVLVDRLPRLKGRILGADHRPMDAVLVQAWVDGAVEPVEAQTDAEGQFQLQLDSTGGLGLRLEAVGGEGLQQIQREWAGHEIPADFQLGDVVLMPAARIAFEAHDPEGQAVEGALGFQAGRMLKGQASDKDGRGEVILPPTTNSAWVVAPGYQPAEINLQGTFEQQVALLRPDTTLALQVLDGDNLSMSGATLHVWTAEGLFAFADPLQPSVWNASRRIGQFVRSESEADARYSVFQADERGRLRITGVTVGAPIWVEVVDRLGNPLHQQRIPALAAGEERDERIVVPQLLREFHATVRDRLHNRLVDVTFEIEDEQGQHLQAQSTLEGAIHLRDLSGDRYHIRIAKRGFVTQTLADYSLSGRLGSHADTPAEFVLDRGHDVAVLIVDADDRPVKGGVVSARRLSDQTGYSATPKGAPDQTLQDLDQGAVQVTLRLGGVTYLETMQAPLARSVEFQVPAHGQVEVQWQLPASLPSAEPLRLVAIAVQADGQKMPEREPVVIEVGARTDQSGLSVFSALLPGTYQILWQRQAASPQQPGAPELVAVTPAGSATAQPKASAWEPFGEPRTVQVDLRAPARILMPLQ